MSIRGSKEYLIPKLTDAFLYLFGSVVIITSLAMSVYLFSDYGTVTPRFVPFFILAMVLYLVGHVLRIARLALLIADSEQSLRRLAVFHFWTSAISAGLPFKLGDIMRIGVLTRFVRTSSAISYVWVERVLDAAILLPIMVILAAIAPANLIQYLEAFLLTIAFIIISLGLMFIAPDNLRRVATYIFRRYNHPKSIVILARINSIRVFLDSLIFKLDGRTVSLVVYSFFIWIFEFFAFAAVMIMMQGGVDPVVGLLSLFSALIEGNTIINLFKTANWPGGELFVNYLLISQVPLLSMGLLLTLFFRSTIFPNFASKRN